VRYAAIGDAGLVALAPALRRRPALKSLCLNGKPFGDEGLGTPPSWHRSWRQMRRPRRLEC